MTYRRNRIAVGRGRLSSASAQNGTVELVLQQESRLVHKRMQADGRQIYGGRLVGYCDDLWLLPAGRLLRIGEELTYVANESEDAEALGARQSAPTGVLSNL